MTGRASDDPGARDAAERLLATLSASEELLARFAAPLWSRVGRPVYQEDLGWARGLWGDERAPEVVWQALRRAGALTGEPPTLHAAPLSRMMARLAADEAPPCSTTSEPRTVWTLPSALPDDEGRRNSYLQAAISLVEEARDHVLMVSPYIELRGVGYLFARLSDALTRGVRLVLITHDVADLATVNSHALEELRREAERVGGDLAVFSAESASGRDRELHPLLHAKFVVSDDRSILLGSANLTAYGLTTNLEVGALLGRQAAREASEVVSKLIETGLVRPVFHTGDWSGFR
ncbi:MAG: hypothetical protein IN804_00500 [Cutibacterium sp.]|nr:hypothetical protein [Cutibacterium sp.]